METLRCERWPHGLYVASADTDETHSEAFEAFIPACIVHRSSVLQHLSCEAVEGSSFNLPAPTGYIQTWLLTLPSLHSDVSLDVDVLARGIMVCAHLKLGTTPACMCVHNEQNWNSFTDLISSYVGIQCVNI